MAYQYYVNLRFPRFSRPRGINTYELDKTLEEIKEEKRQLRNKKLLRIFKLKSKCK